jgi:hypothetical protein
MLKLFHQHSIFIGEEHRTFQNMNIDEDEYSGQGEQCARGQSSGTPRLACPTP